MSTLYEGSYQDLLLDLFERNNSVNNLVDTVDELLLLS